MWKNLGREEAAWTGAMPGQGPFKCYSVYFFTLSTLALPVSQGKEWPPLVVDPTDYELEGGVSFP